jgi:hypothetical protein
VIAVGRALLAAPLALCLAGCSYTVADPGGYVRNRTSPFMVFEDPWQPAPAMDESRRIEERDCTKPLDGVTGNLKCR